jgi:hypothetical protein
MNKKHLFILGIAAIPGIYEVLVFTVLIYINLYIINLLIKHTSIILLVV